METKIYFDLEKISVIEVTPETLSDYVFYPEKPAYQRHIFGFIPSRDAEALESTPGRSTGAASLTTDYLWSLMRR